MSLEVRLATNLDVPEVVRVIRAVYDEYGFPWEEEGYHRDLYDLKAFYFDLGDQFYIAEVDGRAVGTAALELFEPVPGEPGHVGVHDGKHRVTATDCSIERLYVDPNIRRMGVGRALMGRVIDDAKARGRQRMEIWSDKKFVEAHRLYERFGARVVGERLCDDPDQSPEWGLLLEL